MQSGAVWCRRAATLAACLALSRAVLGQEPSPTPASTPVVTATTPVSTAPPAAAATSSPSSPRPLIEALPDPVRVAPAEVAFANPLAGPWETPPSLAEHAAPADLQTRVALLVAVRLDAAGKVLDAVAVEPPLKALTMPLAALAPRWRFTPARKAGQPVATWATYGPELDVRLSRAVFTAFTLAPVQKADPIPVWVEELPEEARLRRYPREIAPADPGTVSIEDVDVLPTPDKTPWSFDSTRPRSRVTAFVEVAADGAIGRVLATGESEPLIASWLRQTAAKWKAAPGTRGGKPAGGWMALDATLEYTIDSAKKKAERSIKKNLRGAPAR